MAESFPDGSEEEYSVDSQSENQVDSVDQEPIKPTVDDEFDLENLNNFDKMDIDDPVFDLPKLPKGADLGDMMQDLAPSQEQEPKLAKTIKSPAPAQPLAQPEKKKVFLNKEYPIVAETPTKPKEKAVVEPPKNQKPAPVQESDDNGEEKKQYPVPGDMIMNDEFTFFNISGHGHAYDGTLKDVKTIPISIKNLTYAVHKATGRHYQLLRLKDNSYWVPRDEIFHSLYTAIVKKGSPTAEEEEKIRRPHNSMPPNNRIILKNREKKEIEVSYWPDHFVEFKEAERLKRQKASETRKLAEAAPVVKGKSEPEPSSSSEEEGKGEEESSDSSSAPEIIFPAKKDKTEPAKASPTKKVEPAKPKAPPAPAKKEEPVKKPTSPVQPTKAATPAKTVTPAKPQPQEAKTKKRPAETVPEAAAEPVTKKARKEPEAAPKAPATPQKPEGFDADDDLFKNYGSILTPHIVRPKAFGLYKRHMVASEDEDLNLTLNDWMMIWAAKQGINRNKSMVVRHLITTQKNPTFIQPVSADTALYQLLERPENWEVFRHLVSFFERDMCDDLAVVVSKMAPTISRQYEEEDDEKQLPDAPPAKPEKKSTATVLAQNAQKTKVVGKK